MHVTPAEMHGRAIETVLLSGMRRNVAGMAGGVLMAAVMTLTGCSSGSDDSEKETGSSNSPAADSEKAPGSEQGDASDTGQASSADQSTAESAVAAWVTAVVKNQPKEACLLMGEAATGSKPARAGTEATCDSNSPEGAKILESIGKFRESFTPDPPSADPEVEVAETPATGDETVVPAEKITVDGQTLDKIILSRSTGVEAGQLDVQVHSSKIDDRWYVTNIGFDIG